MPSGSLLCDQLSHGLKALCVQLQSEPTRYIKSLPPPPPPPPPLPPAKGQSWAFSATDALEGQHALQRHPQSCCPEYDADHI